MRERNVGDGKARKNQSAFQDGQLKDAAHFFK